LENDFPSQNNSLVEADEKALVALVEQRLDDSRKADNRISHESIWYTNVAWTLGYQNLKWSTDLANYRNVDVFAGGQRSQPLQTNRILPALQNRTARMCKTPPKYEVRPNSSDIEDKEACELASQIIDHYWDSENVNRKRIDLYMWKQQCGHSYVKVFWNPDKGRKFQDPTTGEIVKEGDIGIEILSPFEVYPDPIAKRMEDMQHAVQIKVRPLSYFVSTYGEKGALVKEEPVTLMGLQYQERISSMTSKGSSAGTVKNSAVEKILYEMPTKDFPQGRMVVTAGGVLLENKPLPIGELPLVKFDDIIVGGRYYSEAVVTHAIPVQAQYNILINKRNTWINALIAGKYSVPRGAGISQEAMTDQPEIVEYDPVPNAPDGGRPMAIPVPMLPQFVYTEEDRLLNSLYEIMGISDVARGQIPSSSISGVGMQILLEADATRIGLVTEADEHSWAKVGRLILLFAQEYIQNERLLKLASNQGYQVKSFVGADIKDNTDVLVVRGSTLPNSTAMKRQDILNIFSQGLFGDPADTKVRENVLSLLEYGDVQEAWKKENLKEMQMKKIIDKIEQGVPSYPTEFDDAAYWLRELDAFRLGDKYEKLSPQIQMMVMEMMQACVTAVMPPSHKAPPAPIAEEPQPLSQEPQGEMSGL